MGRGLDQARRVTDRATARASASSRAPVTVAVISVVAPSPSAACWRARSRATASSAAPRATAAAEPAPTGSAPAAPDARTKTVSLVLVSPSTDSWSQVRAAAGRSRPQRTSGATAASVSTTDSIVAIRGWIIPTPLAMPQTVTVTGRPSPPGSSTVVDATLVFESVVRSATAAASSPSSVALEGRDERSQAGRHLPQRQPRPDDPGREVERPFDLHARRPREHGRDLGLVGVARGAGRGVRAAAGRDDRLGPAEPAPRVARRRRQMRLRQPDGRGRERVRGEDGGHGGRTRRRDGRRRGPAGPRP